ncbi:MAG: exodeoxyribonuclease VII small subunit [Blastocatellia bacterium]
MAKPKDKEQSFETSLTALEQIVGQLESGELPLERSLELFEDGVALARRCQAQLQDAERKVELLLRERGEVKVVPFDSAEQAQPTEAPAKPASFYDDDDTIPF